MKTILITGGAIRIGKKISEHLLKANHNVIIHSNNSYEQALQIKKLYAHTQIITCNLKDHNQIEELFNNIDHIDVLINNAATFKNDTLSNFSLENFNECININLLAPILLIQQFAKKFNSGHVINILDSWCYDLPPNFISYTLSKNSLRDFTLIAAQTLSPNIKINGISLGFTMHKDGYPKDFFEKMQQKYPSTVELVCQTIDFILSQEGTGKIIDLCKSN